MSASTTLAGATTWRETLASFPPLQNDLVLRAAHGEETPRAGVWVMRQAGRYLPEFLAIRKDHTFFECCQTPSLASALTLQPIDRYPRLDASIIFCDILVVPQALGMVVTMEPGRGPVLPSPLLTPADLARLRTHVDVDKELGYLFEAITLTRKGLGGRVPLIGFCGAPWTLMAYMCEGGGSKTFERSKRWLYEWPEETRGLLERIADVCADLLVGQVLAGAQMLQVFDSWAGELTPYHFRTFALPACQRIASRVRAALKSLGHPGVPITLFPKGVHAPSSLTLLADPSQTGYDTLGLDWALDPVEVRSLLGPKVNLQGNFDPAVLYGGYRGIRDEVRRMSTRWKEAGGGWIANLGHGITPGVKPEMMGWFLECVHWYARREWKEGDEELGLPQIREGEEGEKDLSAVLEAERSGEGSKAK